MPKLQSVSEHSDRRRPAPRETLHLQQQQILLRHDARTTGGLLTEAEEPTDVIPELGERPVVDLRRRTALLTRLSSHSQIISLYDIHPRGELRNPMARSTPPRWPAETEAPGPPGLLC